MEAPVYDIDREFVNFTLGEELVVGQNYTVEFKYEGKMDNSLGGLYYSSYNETVNGNLETK